MRQSGPGRHLWQTPHGICYLVDADGTRRLPDRDAELILTAPPGVDVYPADVELVLDGSYGECGVPRSTPGSSGSGAPPADTFKVDGDRPASLVEAEMSWRGGDAHGTAELRR